MARGIFLLLAAMIVGSANGQSNHRSSDSILDSLKGSLNGVIGTLATVSIDTTESLNDFLDNKAVVIEQTLWSIAQDAEAFRLTIGQVGQSTGLKTNEATKLVSDTMASLTNLADQLSLALIQSNRNPRAPNGILLKKALSYITTFIDISNPQIIDPLLVAIYNGNVTQGLLTGLIDQLLNDSTRRLLATLLNEVQTLCVITERFPNRDIDLKTAILKIRIGIRLVAQNVNDRGCRNGNLICLVITLPRARQIVQLTSCGNTSPTNLIY